MWYSHFHGTVCASSVYTGWSSPPLPPPTRHGEAAPSYPHVVQACRMLWNLSLVTLSTQNGRNSLVPLLLELLDIMAALSSRRRKAVSLTSGGLEGIREWGMGEEGRGMKGRVRGVSDKLLQLISWSACPLRFLWHCSLKLLREVWWEVRRTSH